MPPDALNSSSTFVAWYGRSTEHVWRTAVGDLRTVPAARGVDQGDLLANPIFAVSTAGPAEALKADLMPHDPAASVFQVADDVQVVTTTNLFAFIADSTTRHWQPAGLTFKPSKDQCWTLDPDPLPDRTWQSKRVERMRCLGPDLAADNPDDNSAPPRCPPCPGNLGVLVRSAEGLPSTRNWPF